MQIQLIVANAHQNGQTIPINVPTFTIGRAEGCNLRSRSATVSRNHCTIQVTNGTVTVQDLGGENGTYVNGNRITSVQPLQDGDKLAVGTHIFTVSIKAEANKTASDQGDFFELTPSSMAVPKSESSATQSADPHVKSSVLQAKKPGTEAEVMFEIRLNGQRVSVTKSRLFDLARRGSVLPDDLITVAGTRVFADSIQGIVFGDKSSPPPPPPPVSPGKSGVQTSAPPPAKTPLTTDAVNDPFALLDLGDIASEVYGSAENAPVVRVARKESAFNALWKALDISFSRVYSLEGNDLVIHSIKALYYVVVVVCVLGIFWQLFYFGKDCVDSGNPLEMLDKHAVGLSVVTFGCVLIVVIVRVLLEMLLLAWVESANQEKQEEQEEERN